MGRTLPHRHIPSILKRLGCVAREVGKNDGSSHGKWRFSRVGLVWYAIF
jgi:hypothetical protein